MADLQAPTTLNSLVGMVNSKITPKLLTEDNFEVLSVRALNQSHSTEHNTAAKIRVDLAVNNPNGILLESDRYSTRTVYFTRIDLKEIAALNDLVKNADGSYVAVVTDKASAIAALGANISEDEVRYIQLTDRGVLTANAGSLGYIGSITFAAAAGTDGEEPVEEEPPVVVVSAIEINGVNSLVFEGTTTFSITTTPVTDTIPTVTWSATHGTIDQTGEYMAPALGENVTDTITAKITNSEGVEITATLTLTLTEDQ